jgi:hypothetical protein
MTEARGETREQTADEPSVNQPAAGETFGAGFGTRGRIRYILQAQRQRLSAGVALSALAVFVVVTNLLWVRAHRRGLPFDIDEAGYLQRAIRGDDALRHGGLSGLWHTFRLPDPQAPLLPVAAALVRHLTNAGPVGLIASEQVFVVIAVVSTFLLARHLDGRLLPALVAAACVAALPGVIDGGRGFAFAVPAAALMTATLASQLAAADFQRLSPALAWGLVFGLATLTRTVMLALLPAAVLAALVRLALARARPRQWVNLGAGLLVASLTASIWYTATWHPVWNYLTSYGYGQQAAGYGQGRPLLSWDRWTFRIVYAMDTEVYLPLSIAALVCAAVAAGRLVRQRPTWLREPQHVAARFLRRGWGTVTLVLVVDYAVLSSTRNPGSSFELPLLPAAAALLVSAASMSGRTGRILALTASTGAAAFSIIAADGLLPGPPERRDVQLGPVSVTAYDDRGPLLYYSTRFLPATAGGTEPLLRRWARSNRDLTSTLFEQAAQHRKPVPVVFFAVQDPFVNTNSLALLAQERGVTLPIGVLASPKQAHESFAAQLQDPARGIPDVVIIGPPSANPAAETFAPPVDMTAVRRAAHVDGFHKSSDVVLPDRRHMELWWRTSQ